MLTYQKIIKMFYCHDLNQGLAVTSISNHEGPKHPYLSGNHAPNSYDQSNTEETQYNRNMVKNHMKTKMGNSVPQSKSTSLK